MGGIEDVDVHVRPVHVLQAGLDVPADLGPDRGQGVGSAGWKGPAAGIHVRAARESERILASQRAPGLDGLDDRGAATEERVRVAGLGMPGNRLAELLVRLVVRGIEVVAVEAVGPLYDVGIEVDDRAPVAAHRVAWRAAAASALAKSASENP